jgi:hypothetical protein
MSTTQGPIEDAIIALATEHADLYGEPFFHWASCELEHGFAELLAEALTKLGYQVSAVDDYTVAWEPPPDEYHIRSRPPFRVRSATDEDLQDWIGSSRLVIGFPSRRTGRPRLHRGRFGTTASTARGSVDSYEAENQAMLRVYEAQSCDVVRNEQGQVISAAVTYPDGRSEVVYDSLSSARAPGRCP